MLSLIHTYIKNKGGGASWFWLSVSAPLKLSAKTILPSDFCSVLHRWRLFFLPLFKTSGRKTLAVSEWQFALFHGDCTVYFIICLKSAPAHCKNTHPAEYFFFFMSYWVFKWLLSACFQHKPARSRIKCLFSLLPVQLFASFCLALRSLESIECKRTFTGCLNGFWHKKLLI